MRLGLLSDTHNAAANLQTALNYFRRAQVETVIHCGDLTNLEVGLQLVECRVICAFGNGDWNANEIRRNLLYFRPDNAGEMIYRGELGGVKIAATHGHLEGTVDELIRCGEFAYVFHGHTHRRRDERIGFTRVINPGALGGSRFESRSFAVLDPDLDQLDVQIISG